MHLCCFQSKGLPFDVLDVNLGPKSQICSTRVFHVCLDGCLTQNGAPALVPDTRTSPWHIPQCISWSSKFRH